jgi:hypothetical protein
VVEDAVNNLRAAGLVHTTSDGFIFATRAAVVTAWRPFLFAVGFGILWAMFSAAVTRLNRGSEVNERALFRRWVDDVAHDLGAVPDRIGDELGATGARQGR